MQSMTSFITIDLPHMSSHVGYAWGYPSDVGDTSRELASGAQARKRDYMHPNSCT